MSKAQFQSEFYSQSLAVPAPDWREFAESDEFQVALTHRLKHPGIGAEAQAWLRSESMLHPGWRDLATLDAATRLVSSLVESGGIQRGAAALSVLGRFTQSADLIPASFGRCAKAIAQTNW